MPATRSEISDSNQVVARRAIWCGIVFALSALLTVLNFAPPFEISYRVRSEVVVAAAKLGQLEASSKENASQVARGNLKPAQLVGLKVLDTSNQTISAPIATKQEIALVEFDSVWSHMCSTDAHDGWVKAITESTHAELQDSDLASQHRLAEWELLAAKHYRDRHEFLSGQAPSSDNSGGDSYSLANHSSSSNPPTGFASFTRPASSQGVNDLVHAALEDDVTAAQEKLEQAAGAWEELIEQSVGLVEIASRPEVITQARGIPVWMTLSIIVLGISAGIIATGLYFRLQSSGGYDPAKVANHLSELGIPVAGHLHLPSDQLDLQGPVGRVIRLLRSVRGILARNLIVFSETTLGIWVLLILLRLSVDGMWRQVFLDNPLAALGRVAIGLP